VAETNVPAGALLGVITPAFLVERQNGTRQHATLWLFRRLRAVWQFLYLKRPVLAHNLWFSWFGYAFLPAAGFSIPVRRQPLRWLAGACHRTAAGSPVRRLRAERSGFKRVGLRRRLGGGRQARLRLPCLAGFAATAAMPVATKHALRTGRRRGFRWFVVRGGATAWASMSRAARASSLRTLRRRIPSRTLPRYACTPCSFCWEEAWCMLGFRVGMVTVWRRSHRRL